MVCRDRHPTEWQPISQAMPNVWPGRAGQGPTVGARNGLSYECPRLCRYRESITSSRLLPRAGATVKAVILYRLIHYFPRQQAGQQCQPEGWFLGGWCWQTWYKLGGLDQDVEADEVSFRTVQGAETSSRFGHTSCGGVALFTGVSWTPESQASSAWRRSVPYG